MNLSLLTEKVIGRIRRVGFRQTAADLLGRAFATNHGTDFDRRNGTDTDGHVPLWKFRIPFSSAKHGVAYATVGEDRIIDALAGVPRDAMFADLGCGKGRALIVAARQGFRQVIGVEFVPELAMIAHRNLLITHTDATVYHSDAGSFRLPDGPLCVYFYNPFGPEVMRLVADRLKEHAGPLWVVYLNHACQGASCTDLFDAWLPRMWEREGVLVWSNVGPA